MKPLTPITCYIPVSPTENGGISLVELHDPNIVFRLKEQSVFVHSKEELVNIIEAAYREGAWKEQDGQHAQHSQSKVLREYIKELLP